MYIGDKKINKIVRNNNKVKIEFKEAPEIELNEELFDKIVSEEKGQGNVTDAINHYLATKILYDLAQYDLDFYMINTISVAIQTLAHNLREDLFRDTFGCSGGDAMNLKFLIDKDYARNKISERIIKE